MKSVVYDSNKLLIYIIGIMDCTYLNFGTSFQTAENSESGETAHVLSHKLINNLRNSSTNELLNYIMF